MKEFYICHNPFIKFADDVLDYLCHATKPRFFALIRKIDLSKPVSLGCSGHNIGFVYRKPDGELQFSFLIVNQYIDRVKDPSFSQLLREAVHFYVNYTVLSYRTDASGRSGYKFFEDYNSMTPGVQLFQLPAQNIFILSHPLVLKSFKAEEDIFHYLEQQFGYSKIQLESGKMNVVGSELASSPNLAPNDYAN